MHRVPLDSPPRVHRLGVGALLPTEDTLCWDHWSINLFRFDGELCFDGKVHPFGPGWVTVTPEKTPHQFRFTGDTMNIYAHLDFVDAQGGGQVDHVELPVAHDLGSRFARWWSLLDEALHYWYRQPERIDALMYLFLWALVDDSAPKKAGDHQAKLSHPALWQAVWYIKANYGHPLTVAAIAREVGISHKHLSRLFREATDMTVVGYIRAWRVAEAVRLLETTDKPVKVIAAEVGIPDLPTFCKSVRAITGKSPTAHR